MTEWQQKPLPSNVQIMKLNFFLQLEAIRKRCKTTNESSLQLIKKFLTISCFKEEALKRLLWEAINFPSLQVFHVETE